VEREKRRKKGGTISGANCMEDGGTGRRCGGACHEIIICSYVDDDLQHDAGLLGEEEGIDCECLDREGLER
jgi:hypothetical protein